eukprot:4007686-Alexandrium_andersonii.AAC.1
MEVDAQACRALASPFGKNVLRWSRTEKVDLQSVQPRDWRVFEPDSQGQQNRSLLVSVVCIVCSACDACNICNARNMLGRRRAGCRP